MSEPGTGRDAARRPRALILGASSPVAEALAEELADRGWNLALAGRRSAVLAPIASNLALKHGVETAVVDFDALDLAGHETLVKRVCSRGGHLDLAIWVAGYLGDQEQVRSDTSEMDRTLGTNFTGAAIALGHLAQYLEGRPLTEEVADAGGRAASRRGLIVITSVAGDRGRQSNYTYGAAKGGLALFAQGLRNRLYSKGLHVMTAKPGFIDTPMTEGLDGLFLVASPERVAQDILRAFDRGRDEIYTPWFWRWIMLVIRLIPERLFKRLSL